MSERDKKPTIFFRCVVDKEALVEFKKAVLDKHGDLHGNMTLETTNALKNWTKAMKGV